VRGEPTYSLRTYRDDLERVQERVAALDHAGDGCKHGSADALRWLWGEYDRLQQAVAYDTIERGVMMRKIGNLTRALKSK
jgi:hypothetical protein